MWGSEREVTQYGTIRRNAVLRRPDPQNPGQLVEAKPLRIVAGNLDAKLEMHLEDGAKVWITLSVTEISRIDTRKDANGRPIYNIDTQGKSI